MNWTAIGAIGELLGAIGVIASLLYLARQMRSAAADARRAVADGRRAAAQAVLAKLNTSYQAAATNHQLADVYSRGSANLSALSPEEAMQFAALLLSFVRPDEELLHYKKRGAVEDWVWESVELVVLPNLATPGGLEWWAKRKGWFTSALQAHVASVLPPEAAKTLTVFEQAIEGQEFRSGVLVGTGSTTPLSKQAAQ